MNSEERRIQLDTNNDHFTKIARNSFHIPVGHVWSYETCCSILAIADMNVIENEYEIYQRDTGWYEAEHTKMWAMALNGAVIERFLLKEEDKV